MASSTRPIPAVRLLHGPLMSVQLSPALVERYTPLAALPKRSPMPAYWWLKLPGSTSRSVASPFNRCDHVDPPLVDLKIPRGGRVGEAATRPANPRVVAARTVLRSVGATLRSLKP